MNDDRLAITVDGPRGFAARWADDEPDAERIPDDLRITTGIPGGDKSLTCSLLGDSRIPRSDTAQLNEVTVYGPGVERVWRGYLSDNQEAQDQQSPAAVGDAARLRDDAAIPFLIVDRDLGKWRESSTARKLANYANFDVLQGFSQEIDNAAGSPSIRLAADGRWATRSISEAFYDQAGLLIGRIYFAHAGRNLAANYTGRIETFSDDAGTTPMGAGSDIIAVGTPSGTYDAPFDPPVPCIALQLYSPAATPSTTDLDRDWRISNLAVYGDHGLTLRGGDPSGVWGGDVWRYLLDSAQGPIGYTADSIADGSDFIVPHLVGDGPVTVEGGAELVGKFYENEWKVDDRIAYWKPSSELGRLWYVRQDEGARAEGVGYSEEHLFNGTLVTYTDPSGQSRTVGPPGSGFDSLYGQSTEGLQDTRDDNPLNEWGRRRWARLGAGMTTEAGAIRLGERFTQTIQTRQLSGSLPVENGMLIDATGARYPAWAAKGGDRVVVLGSGDTTERFIVGTDYAHSSRSNGLTLDSEPETLASTLERLSVVLVGTVG